MFLERWRSRHLFTDEPKSNAPLGIKGLLILAKLAPKWKLKVGIPPPHQSNPTSTLFGAAPPNNLTLPIAALPEALKKGKWT